MEEATTVCPQCNGNHIIYDDQIGEEVCSNCGLVLGQIINYGPEYRTFNLIQDWGKVRTGKGYDLSLYDKGLSTKIGRNRDARGTLLSKDVLYLMQRLRQENYRSNMNSSKPKNLIIAMNELDRLSSEIKVPKNVKENAILLYRKAMDKELTRGRSIDAFVAACLYAACRINSIPRTLKQVSKASKRYKNEVAMTYRILHEALELKPPIDGPYKFLPGIASKLKITPRSEEKALEILKQANNQKELVGKDPRGMAAAALYLACQITGEYCIQQDISIAAGITDVTLRNRIKGIKKAIKNSN